MDKSLNIIGGGMAGCEAAWQAANMGIDVTLFEMRPKVKTFAHQTEKLGEMVCSNSFALMIMSKMRLGFCTGR